MKTVLAHARFAVLPVLQLMGIATFLIGGAWLWLGAVLVASFLFLDEASGEYRFAIGNPNRLALDGILYAVVPLTTLLYVGLVLHTASPGSPAAGLASALAIGAAGVDPWIGLAGAIVSVGLLSAPAVGAFGHELVHRTGRTDRLLGQVLLVNCLHTAFAVQHVSGHHRDIGTPADFTSVPRGMSFWRYLPGAVVGVRRTAARIEAARMRRRGLPWFSWKNRFLRGLVVEIAVVVAIVVLAGPVSLAALLLAAGIAVTIIELAAYVGHYGLVRVPGRPVMPRHSWNAARFLSTSVTLNLPRHSHHHASGGTPYWALEMMDEAPVLPFGLTVTSAIAMVPPLWFRVIGPRLDDWDHRLASAEERALVANSDARFARGRRSGADNRRLATFARRPGGHVGSHAMSTATTKADPAPS